MSTKKQQVYPFEKNMDKFFRYACGLLSTRRSKLDRFMDVILVSSIFNFFAAILR